MVYHQVGKKDHLSSIGKTTAKFDREDRVVV